MNTDLKHLILKLEFCPSILHKIQLPKEDQISGDLKPETWAVIKNILLDESNSTVNKMDFNSNEIFLDVQTVPDKVIQQRHNYIILATIY